MMCPIGYLTVLHNGYLTAQSLWAAVLPEHVCQQYNTECFIPITKGDQFVCLAVAASWLLIQCCFPSS